MADKVTKPKKSKTKKDDKGVLAALPSTRPERIGTRRTGTTVSPATQTAAASAKTAKPEGATTSASDTSYPRTSPAAKKPATRRKAAASRPTAARRKAAASRPTAARRKAAAPRTFEPTEAAEAAAGAADERAAGVTTEPRPRFKRAGVTPEPRPRPVREGAPGMGTTSADRESASLRSSPPPADAGARSSESGRPSGVELVTTAVQAAGELTQIGLTIGGRIIKRAVDRLPKP
jgi:hypothetical protein